MTSTDRQYSAGTVNDGARDKTLFSSPFFGLAGKKSGHGAVAWLPAPDYDMPAPRPWPPRGPGRPPVIALLDSGVADRHPWLPPSANGTPFVKEHWPDVGLPGFGPANDRGEPDLGSHWIHGTFIAGRIRLRAPRAQLVSMRVMNAKGKVNQDDVIGALAWLTSYAQDNPVDIVLMAFGRPADPGDPDLRDLRKAMAELSHVRPHVQFVASAGNEHSQHTVYPAAFAEHKRLHVASVGAGTKAAERAPYSNYGPWVKEWRNGTNVISLAPLTTANLTDPARTGQQLPYTVAETGYGYAWWSGTSFAAARYAADLANQLSAK
jgi:hypothetical protein